MPDPEVGVHLVLAEEEHPPQPVIVLHGVPPEDLDRPGGRALLTGDRSHKGALAGAVAAQEAWSSSWPFLMFIFLLALGEDYNILMMTRIREEARALRLRDAVARSIGVTGTTVTSAGLVLAGSFLVLAVVGGSESGGSQIRDIGLGLALGILMDAFLVRTLLVPSVAIQLGRWNWWPSRASGTRQPSRTPQEMTGPQTPDARVSSPAGHPAA